jgi:hypothetical protein
MSAAAWLLGVCVVCVCLAACGGSDSGSSDRQQITSIFSAVDSEMAHGDYTSACNRFSQRQQSNIVTGARKAGLKVSSCAGALASLIKMTGITRAQLAQTFGGAATPKIHSVSIHGNQATATFTDSLDGHPYTETECGRASERALEGRPDHQALERLSRAALRARNVAPGPTSRSTSGSGASRTTWSC